MPLVGMCRGTGLSGTVVIAAVAGGGGGGGGGDVSRWYPQL